MMTKRQVITVWNEWAKYQVTRPLLAFIGYTQSGITDDETYEHTPGVKVQDLQAKRAADFLREMADALDGGKDSNTTAGNDGGNKEES